MEFRGYQSTYVASLPPVDQAPLFQAHDSFYRLLLKACAPDPADRFVSADELRVQLLGVLREVVATRTRGRGRALRRPRSCSGHPRSPDDVLDWQDLPALRVDESDPQASWLRTVSIEDPARTTGRPGGRARGQPGGPARQVPRRAGGGPPRPGRQRGAGSCSPDDPWEWRAAWMTGLVALARGRTAEAQSAFNAVYGQVPGELAPKLALAFACETGGEADVAESLYVTCARTDANYIAPAAFGLARIRSGRGDIDGAIRALDLVPPTSRAFTPARRRRASLLAESGGGLALAGRRAARASTTSPSTRSTGPGSAWRCCSRRSRSSRRRGWTRPSPSPDSRRPSRSCATGSRRRTATWRATHPHARSGSGWSTRPTPYVDGPCDDDRRRVVTVPQLCGTGRRRRAVLRGLWRRAVDASALTADAARPSRGPARTPADAPPVRPGVVSRVRRGDRRRRLLHRVRRQGAQPARPLHRAAGRVGGRRVRPGRPPLAQRGRRRTGRPGRAGQPRGPRGV